MKYQIRYLNEGRVDKDYDDVDFLIETLRKEFSGGMAFTDAVGNFPVRDMEESDIATGRVLIWEDGDGWNNDPDSPFAVVEIQK